MENDETRKPETRTRKIATDDGKALQTYINYINVGSHGITGETQRLWINMN